MEINEYQKMFEIEETYWWFRGKRQIFNTLLTKYPIKNNCRIVDIGCGTGKMIDFLEKFGLVQGIDFSKTALDFCRARGKQNIQQARASELPYRNDTFDLVTAADLLEHVENDYQVAQELYRVCKKNGVVLLSVPTYRFLWSEHDIALGHKRRYNLQEFKTLLKNAGFDILRISYTNTFLFLPILLTRLIRKIGLSKKKKKPQSDFYFTIPRFINSFLTKLLFWEAYLLRYIIFPFGVSIVCIARKS